MGFGVVGLIYILVGFVFLGFGDLVCFILVFWGGVMWFFGVVWLGSGWVAFRFGVVVLVVGLVVCLSSLAFCGVGIIHIFGCDFRIS